MADPSSTEQLEATVRQLTSTVASLTRAVEALSDEMQRARGESRTPSVPAAGVTPGSFTDVSGGLSGGTRRSTADPFPFHVDFIAGSLALPLSFAVMHPLDTIRTQMQAVVGTSSGSLANGMSSVTNGSGATNGFTTQLTRALRAAGAKVLSRGFFASVLGAAPQGGLRFGTYGVAQRWLDPYFDSPALRNACCAVAGDFASSLVKVPREVVVQRLQTGMYRSTLHAVGQILRTEGPLGLFTGYTSTAARDVPFMVVLFVSYEQFKSWKIRLSTHEQRIETLQSAHHHHHGETLSDAETILWGGISGALAGWTTTPLDVIKTRIMTADKVSDRSAAKVVSSLAAGGPRGFFVGAGPRAAWWFCVCSIFFASYERLRELLD